MKRIFFVQRKDGAWRFSSLELREAAIAHNFSFLKTESNYGFWNHFQSIACLVWFYYCFLILGVGCHNSPEIEGLWLMSDFYLFREIMPGQIIPRNSSILVPFYPYKYLVYAQHKTLKPPIISLSGLRNEVLFL